MKESEFTPGVYGNRLLAMFLVLTSLVIDASAQELRPVPFPLPEENLSLAGYATYTFATGKIKDPGSLSTYPFLPFTKAFSAKGRALTDSVEAVWVAFRVQNKLLSDTFLVLKVNPAPDRITLYRFNSKVFQEEGRAGATLPLSQLSMHRESRKIKVKIIAGTTAQFFLHLHGKPTWGSTLELQSANRAIIERSLSDAYYMPGRKFAYLMVGFSLALFFFSLIKYSGQNGDKAYLWYGSANLLAFFFVLVDAGDIVFDSDLWNNLHQRDFFLLFNGAGMLSYLKFQVHLLELKKHKPALAKAINVFSIILLTAIFVTLVANQLRILPFTFNVTRALSQFGFLLFILLIFLYLTKKRTGYYKYIYYGILCYILGFIIYIPYIWFEWRRYLPPLIRGNFIMGVPTILEMLFFFKALVYRDQETEREKVKYQQQLIEQLEHNKTLQESFTKNLEKQVKDRTNELIEQRNEIEKQREDKLTAEFEQRFSESELKALRAQMNPHFIFNVLNTIESYALENNASAASDMIQKFSRLTRLVLENSLHQVVPVENDLEALRLYIQLEQIRYSDRFEATIQVDNEVLAGNYCIPPMIIQPYVENAILHGLRNLPSGSGILKIHVSKQASCLKIDVEDNGIGRSKSAALRKNDPIKRSSLGMSVTQDRISIFNNLTPQRKAAVNMFDLDPGTRVEIIFFLTE